uniref:Gastric triacylglycerol lipase n=1 Tax=Cacopsylla melanoneura TaxID=428564 RepID=A0A8D9E787_9HEMI
MHRIPHGKNRKADPLKKPVFLQHGLLTSSADWLLTGPKVGLGFLLADKGYDVWLGNIRGNTYSRRHVKLSPDGAEFWDFSFHEMGVYDMPAFIDFILKKTNQDKVAYIGHSMGTTMFYVMASMRPEYNEKILVQLSLAPIAYLGHTTSAVRLAAPFAKIIYDVLVAVFHGEFLSRSPLLNQALKLFFTLNDAQMIFLQNLVFFITGRDPDQFKHTIIPELVGHDPAGISAKALFHYAQFINNPNTFRQFDYGPLENVQHYNSSVPPDYNISAITSKVGLFYGENDLLGDPTDVKLFYPQIEVNGT